MFQDFFYTKNKILKAPSIFNTLCGALVMAVGINKQDDSIAVLPDIFDGYILDYQIKKVDNQNSLAIGVYLKDSKRYLIKYWYGKARDLNYYSLVHEFLVAKILSGKFKIHMRNDVYIPSAVEYFQSLRSFAAVFEFIEGQTLDAASLSDQAQIWKRVVDDLSHISNFLTQEEQSIIGRRGIIFYFGIVSVIVGILFFLRMKDFKIILKAWTTCARIVTGLVGVELSLAHRDLTPSNILVGKDSKIYILDFESATMTLPGYDAVYLSVDPSSEALAKLLEPSLHTQNAGFLRNYIPLHHILGSGEYLKVNEKYLKALYNIYA